MKRSSICPKCGSSDIVADAIAVDRNESSDQQLTVATYRKPEAIFFKGKEHTPVSAWVCAGCGYVEFYADSPRSIKLSRPGPVT